MNPTPVILIIDDQVDNLTLLSALLESDYQIRVACSGQDGVNAAALEPYPDLVLLDVVMPGMDGYVTLEQLRLLPSMHDVPVIFTTALHDEVDEEHGLTMGAADYISKPIRPMVLLARVRAQLEARRARQYLLDRSDRLENEVRLRVRDYQLVQDASLQAMASLAETRDNETGNHILRTQGYVEILGLHLASHSRFADALVPDRLRHIVKAAPLHDVGKVGIPDRILLKPGRLDADEFEIMRTHAAIGGMAFARVIQNLPDPEAEAKKVGRFHDDRISARVSPLAFLETAHDIAKWHHERWDGTGYPDNLAAEAIPVSARLMAVADVFDALISRRVYKEPIPLATVTDMIVEGREKHFDPAVVDAFLVTRQQFSEIAERYSDDVNE